MKELNINENCIGCGACTAIAPDYFELNDEGYACAKVDEVEENNEDVLEAAEGCPTDAIELN